MGGVPWFANAALWTAYFRGRGPLPLSERGRDRGLVAAWREERRVLEDRAVRQVRAAVLFGCGSREYWLEVARPWPFRRDRWANRRGV